MNDPLKRQVLPPGLWVVATPIGNLADLAPRARQALEEAQAVLCEDTRRTSNLMSALGLSKRLERFDEHASETRVEELVARLVAGERLALVSDAGTPGISDPGSRLVARARESGVVVTPFPGASAVVALLSAAGFMETSFVFRGFFPRKSGERKAELARVRAASAAELARVFVWYESPERIAEAIDLVAQAEPEARVVAAKELTKLHERFFAGGAAEVASEVSAEIEREGARGEWCFALHLAGGQPAEPVSEGAGGGAGESSDWVKALHCLLNAGVSASGAAREVSQQFGIARNRVYETALKLSGKKSDRGD